jgi:hypothetical protein
MLGVIVNKHVCDVHIVPVHDARGWVEHEEALSRSLDNGSCSSSATSRSSLHAEHDHVRHTHSVLQPLDEQLQARASLFATPGVNVTGLWGERDTSGEASVIGEKQVRGMTAESTDPGALAAGGSGNAGGDARSTLGAWADSSVGGDIGYVSLSRPAFASGAPRVVVPRKIMQEDGVGDGIPRTRGGERIGGLGVAEQGRLPAPGLGRGGVHGVETYRVEIGDKGRKIEVQGRERACCAVTERDAQRGRRVVCECVLCLSSRFTALSAFKIHMRVCCTTMLASVCASPPTCAAPHHDSSTLNPHGSGARARLAVG